MADPTFDPNVSDEDGVKGTQDLDTDSENQGTSEQKVETDKVFLEVEGRQYSSPEDIKKKIVNADSFIEQLKEERKSDREKIESLTDKVNDLTKKLEEAVKVDDVLDRFNSKGAEESTSTSFDPEELAAKAAERVRQDLTREEQEKRENDNFNYVVAELDKHYGEKKDAVVFSKAAELGYSKDEAVAFARAKPKAFLELFVTKGSGENSLSPSSRSVKTEGMNNDSQERSSLKYSEARTDKDRIELYQQRLKQAVGS